MSQHLFDEFLYVDPDTGMVMCMIADGDGFRPAHAAEELNSVDLALIHRNLSKHNHADTLTVPTGREAEFGALDEFNDINAYINSYEWTYGAQSAPTA